MALLSLDQDRCIGCSACVEVCPIGIVEIGVDGVRERSPELCVGCGHCVAVCPTEALDNERSPLAGQEPIEGEPAWDAEGIKRFMRYRRSIRCYRPEEVPRERLLRLLDIARFAPSGSNSQGLSYLVISDKDKLRRITEVTIDWMRQMAEVGGGGPGVVFQRYGRDYVDRYRDTGKDIILRDAPHDRGSEPGAAGADGTGERPFCPGIRGAVRAGPGSGDLLDGPGGGVRFFGACPDAGGAGDTGRSYGGRGDDRGIPAACLSPAGRPESAGSILGLVVVIFARDFYSLPFPRACAKMW